VRVVEVVVLDSSVVVVVPQLEAITPMLELVEVVDLAILLPEQPEQQTQPEAV
jgi:hypothetical protein